MTLVYPGGSANPFQPSFSPASGQIQVEFSRNPADFAINRMIRLVPVTEEQGFYVRLDDKEQVRVVTSRQFRWAKGADRPTGPGAGFEWARYLCDRSAYGFHLPAETAKQAAWDIHAQNARVQAQLAMSDRTVKVMTALTTSTNWIASTSYFATGTAIGVGGYGTEGNIQKLIQAIRRRVHLNCNGAVKAADLMLVMSPDQAIAWSQTAEVKSYVKNSNNALAFMRGEDATYNAWGLPGVMWGMRIEVDDTVILSAKRGAASQSKGFALGATKLLCISRPGGLVQANGPSFCTVSVFAFEDMTVETRSDGWHRRDEGSVVDNIDVQVTAPLAGVLIADSSS